MKPKDLRDEFAIQAMPSILEDAIKSEDTGYEFNIDMKQVLLPAFVAHRAYTIADAMMAEREKTSA